MADDRVGVDGKSAINKMTGDESIFDMVMDGQNVQVTPEIEQKVKDLMGLMTTRDDLQAKFVLDILFNDERSHHHAFSGFVMAFTNGGALHGGGDEKVYFCPNKVDRKGHTAICAAPIPPNLIKHGIGICLACKRPSKDKDFIGEVLFKLPMESWPKVMERFFYRLECNADIRIGIFKNDLRDATAKEQERQMHGDLLNKVRREREWVRYSLAALVKDGTAGATLQGRLRAFLRA